MRVGLFQNGETILHWPSGYALHGAGFLLFRAVSFSTGTRQWNSASNFAWRWQFGQRDVVDFLTTSFGHTCAAWVLVPPLLEANPSLLSNVHGGPQTGLVTHTGTLPEISTRCHQKDPKLKECPLSQIKSYGDEAKAQPLLSRTSEVPTSLRLPMIRIWEMKLQ